MQSVSKARHVERLAVPCHRCETYQYTQVARAAALLKSGELKGGGKPTFVPRNLLEKE
jgi:hypothetical protein